MLSDTGVGLKGGPPRRCLPHGITRPSNKGGRGHFHGNGREGDHDQWRRCQASGCRSSFLVTSRRLAEKSAVGAGALATSASGPAMRSASDLGGAGELPGVQAQLPP